MNRRELLQGMGAAMMMSAASGVEAQGGDAGGPVYELRIYHTYEGKLEPLLKRFREKETKIFERLDMHGVGYWTPDDEPLKGRTLVYMLKHKSRAAATENWARFSKDPEWVKLKAETEAKRGLCGEARCYVYDADGFFSEGIAGLRKKMEPPGSGSVLNLANAELCAAATVDPDAAVVDTPGLAFDAG